MPEVVIAVAFCAGGNCRKWLNKPLSTALAKVGKAGNPEGGGCCIWYDEPRLLTAIEKRMAAGGKQDKGDMDDKASVKKIRELGDGYALPDGMDAAAYGESRENEGSEGWVAIMAAIRCLLTRYVLISSDHLTCDAICPLLCQCDDRTGHVEQLRGAVEELRVLETQATGSFYTLQNIFGGEQQCLVLQDIVLRMIVLFCAFAGAALAGGPPAKLLYRPGESHTRTQPASKQGGTGRGGGSRGRGRSNHRGGARSK